jgi:tRNA threonylcarbamoyladenosine biosynthesis protein TsaB
MTEGYKILAIESSGTTCGVCLGIDGKLVGEYSIFGRNLHDKLIAEFIRRLLEDNKLTVNDLSAVAVSAGPGSFTGLRIGASIAKALCFDDEVKLMQIPTLEAIAYSSLDVAIKLKANRISAVVHAYKDLYYYQIFDNNLIAQSEIQQVEVSELKSEDKEKVFFCGTVPFVPELGTCLEEYNIISPRFVLSLANKYFAENKFVVSEEFTPLYVQDFEVKTKTNNINNKLGN